MTILASVLLCASVVAGSSHPLFARQEGSRGTSVQLDSENNSFLPRINISLGTPPQTLTALLDIFNGETLVRPDAFRANDSSTFASYIGIPNGKGGRFTAYTDALAVGGWRVKDVPIC